MSELLDALQAEIDKHSKPAQELCDLSTRCFTIVLEYSQTYEEWKSVDKKADLPLRWLAEQWIAIFETLPHIAIQGNVAASHSALSHIQGIAATMQRVNFPWWHLFVECSDRIMADFVSLRDLCDKRSTAMQEGDKL